MSLSILGVFLIGIFSFLMGRDYQSQPFRFTLSDAGNAILCVWALVGCITFIMNWAHVG